VVPTGKIADKEARLVEVQKRFAVTPDDPYIYGEKAQLEYEIRSIRKNREYVTQLSQDVESGRQRFLQSFRVSISDMDAAVQFWTAGVGALVLDTRLVDGANVTRIGFGPESFGNDDGAKFALELVETPGAQPAWDGAVQYIQLGIPVFRLTQVMKMGGDIQSAYGWTDLLAPGGIPLHVRIDETRRDPFEFIAIRTNSIEKSVNYFKGLGMTAGEPTGRKKIEITQYTNTIFQNADATVPDREIGSVLMAYGDPSIATGLMLLPPKSRKSIQSVDPSMRLRVVGQSPLELANDMSTSPEGLPSIFVAPDAFEKAVQGGVQRSASTMAS